MSVRIRPSLTVILRVKPVVSIEELNEVVFMNFYPYAADGQFSV